MRFGALFTQGGGLMNFHISLSDLFHLFHSHYVYYESPGNTKKYVCQIHAKNDTQETLL